MADADLSALRSSFASVGRLLNTVRSLPAAWEVLSTWANFRWLAIYFDSAITPGGVAQQRRLAAYLGAQLLPRAVSDITVALKLKVKLTSDELTLLLPLWVARGGGLLPPTAPRLAFSKKLISPARSIKVPAVVLRDSAYRPDTILLRRATTCLDCGHALPKGATALWRRGVGACHPTCAWPLVDPYLMLKE